MKKLILILALFFSSALVAEETRRVVVHERLAGGALGRVPQIFGRVQSLLDKGWEIELVHSERVSEYSADWMIVLKYPATSENSKSENKTRNQNQKK